MIQSAIGNCQGDPLGGPFFGLIHFHALCSLTAISSSSLFIFVIDDTHIIGLVSVVF